MPKHDMAGVHLQVSMDEMETEFVLDVVLLDEGLEILKHSVGDGRLVLVVKECQQANGNSTFHLNSTHSSRD